MDSAASSWARGAARHRSGSMATGITFDNLTRFSKMGEEVRDGTGEDGEGFVAVGLSEGSKLAPGNGVIAVDSVGFGDAREAFKLGAQGEICETARSEMLVTALLTTKVDFQHMPIAHAAIGNPDAVESTPSFAPELLLAEQAHVSRLR